MSHFYLNINFILRETIVALYPGELTSYKHFLLSAGSRNTSFSSKLYVLIKRLCCTTLKLKTLNLRKMHKTTNEKT